MAQTEPDHATRSLRKTAPSPAANGFLRRTTGGTLHLSSLAEEFLVAGSPCDTRDYCASIADKSGVHDFLKVLRTGKPANWPGEKG